MEFPVIPREPAESQDRRAGCPHTKRHPDDVVSGSGTGNFPATQFANAERSIWYLQPTTPNKEPRPVPLDLPASVESAVHPEVDGSDFAQKVGDTLRKGPLPPGEGGRRPREGKVSEPYSPSSAPPSLDVAPSPGGRRPFLHHCRLFVQSQVNVRSTFWSSISTGPTLLTKFRMQQ